MKNAKKEEKKEERKLRGVYLTDEAVANIFAYAEKHHLSGGLSGAVEYLAFHLNTGHANSKV